MAIAIALTGFNDLGRSVTPTFLFRINLQLSPHCPKMNKKSMWEVKKFQDFCPRDMESCHLAAARRVKLWLLNANLFFEEPHQLNGVFLFEISFFVLEIFTFLYYANEGSDDVIDRSTKTIKY